MRVRTVGWWLLVSVALGAWIARDRAAFQQSQALVRPPAPVDVAPGPPIKLVGIVAPEEGEPLAVLQDVPRGTIDFYLIGDHVPHGATLTQIAAGAVVLRQADGTDVTLAFNKPAEAAGVNGLRVARLPDKTTVLIEMTPPPRAPTGRRQTPGTPASVPGALNGFGIRGTAFDSILAALELQDGDLLLAINDHPLEGFQRATALLNDALRTLPVPVTVTVLKAQDHRAMTYFLGRMAGPVPPPPPVAPPPAPPGPSAGAAEQFTGRLLLLGMVAGQVPRTMDLEMRALDSAHPIRLQIRLCVDAHGAFRGLEISQADPTQEVERVGLKVGDVITAVNGVRLRSPLQTLGAVRKALKAPSVDVELARGSEHFVRTLER